MLEPEISIFKYKALPQVSMNRGGKQTKKRNTKTEQKLNKIIKNMENDIETIDQINKKLERYQTDKNQFLQPPAERNLGLITFQGDQFFHSEGKKKQNKFDLVTQRPREIIEKEGKANQRRKQFSQRIKQPHHDHKPESVLDIKIRQDKQKNPKKYIIMCGEVGLSQEEVFNLKGGTLNYELEKFIKNKGNSYLEESKIKGKTSEKRISKAKTQPVTSQAKDVEGKNRLKNKYENYIPEVFSGLRLGEKKKKKTISTSVSGSLEKEKKSYRVNKINELTDKEEVLGKMVLQKVKRHFRIEKEKGKNYYGRVKSEENIDQTWIEYLRAKIDRADYTLQRK